MWFIEEQLYASNLSTLWWGGLGGMADVGQWCGVVYNDDVSKQCVGGGLAAILFIVDSVTDWRSNHYIVSCPYNLFIFHYWSVLSIQCVLQFPFVYLNPQKLASFIMVCICNLLTVHSFGINYHCSKILGWDLWRFWLENVSEIGPILKLVNYQILCVRPEQPSTCFRERTVDSTILLDWQSSVHGASWKFCNVSKHAHLFNVIYLLITLDHCKIATIN